MESSPTVSVIIPTYNRCQSLQRTLNSLRSQTFPPERFEVIVVDDGSPDDTRSIANQHLPFHLCYERQNHKGATAARNHGAAISRSEVLIFLDDDVTVSSETLEALAEACSNRTNVLVMGTLHHRSINEASVYAATMLEPPDRPQPTPDEVEIPFVECNTELLACKRTDFVDLDMLQDPTEGAGWPNWDDVDFGYRAHLNGFRLLQSGRAIGEHWDYSVSDRTVACHRWYRASRSAVWLFRRHPGLKALIPMLYDKTPIVWGRDSAFLVARKMARRLVSSSWAREGMGKVIGILERHYPSPALLSRLYYLLQGAYMVLGYRQGLRELEMAGAEG